MFHTFISALADACWRTAALMRKELLTLLKDPANRIILLVPALLQALLFGYALSFELKHAPYAVLEPSRSAPPPPCWRGWTARAFSSAWPRFLRPARSPRP